MYHLLYFTDEKENDESYCSVYIDQHRAGHPQQFDWETFLLIQPKLSARSLMALFCIESVIVFVSPCNASQECIVLVYIGSTVPHCCIHARLCYTHSIKYAHTLIMHRHCARFVSIIFMTFGSVQQSVSWKVSLGRQPTAHIMHN